MAITLKDILAGQEKYAEQEKISSSTERMSLSEFRKMLGASQQEAQDQTEILGNIEETSTATAKVQEKVEDGTEKMQETLEGIGDTMKKQLGVMSKFVKVETPKEAKEVAELAKGVPTFTTFGERMKERFTGFKKAFTPDNLKRTILGATNIGGINDKRLARMDYVEQQKLLGSEKSEKELQLDFERRNAAAKEMKKTERDIEEFKAKTGVSDEQMQQIKGGRAEELLSQRAAQAQEFSKYDLRAMLDKRLQQGEGDVFAGKEREEETNLIVEKNADNLKEQLDTQNTMSETLEKIYTTLVGMKDSIGKVGAAEPSDSGPGVTDLLGRGGRGKTGRLGKIGSKLKSMAKTGGRFLMSPTGMAIGGVLAAGAVGGYLGVKAKEYREEKEAANRESELKEISDKPLNVDELKKLPDAGDAWKPADVSARARLENLTNLRVEQGQRFTQEEADLVKQKLDIVIPKELIGTEAVTPKEAPAPTPTNTEEKYKQVFDEQMKKHGNRNIATKIAQRETGLFGTGVSPSAVEPVAANAVYEKSAEVAPNIAATGNTNNTVVAPTNVTNNSTVMPTPRADVRNQDSTFRSMAERRFIPA